MNYRILGPLELHREGVVVPIGAPKQRILLVSLLIRANDVVSTDALIENLWGQEPPDSAWNAIHVYISQLRKVVGGPTGAASEILVTQRPGYCLLVGPDEVDSLRFERIVAEGGRALDDDDAATASVKLRQALGLWRGRALEDFRFDDFARVEIERLEELRLAAIEDRVESDLALGRHRELVHELHQLVRDQPLRERLRGQLMLALYRSGRQAEALEAYRATARYLEEEMGIDPTPAIQELHQRILRQDRILEPPTRAGAEQASVTATVEVAHQPHAREPTDDVATVTALFADIVGSTRLAEALRPEEVRAVVGECLDRMVNAVERHGGWVQAYPGDGIAAYFGVPEAHEDDPSRAASAALQIVGDLGEYGDEVQDGWGVAGLAVRVGLNTGRTVVATLGSSEPTTQAFGDPLNVAARLEARAEPGTIAVGADLASRLMTDYVLEPFGELTVKGRSEPVQAWRLIGRAARAPAPTLTPLFDRVREMSRIDRVAGEIAAGRGQILLVGGEPGIGKSRLLSELRTLLPEEVLWLEGRCASYGIERQADGIADAIRGWVGLDGEESHRIIQIKLRAKLEAELGEAGAPLLLPLGRFLGVRGPSEQEPTAIGHDREAPEAEPLQTWLESLAARRPVVLAVEDLHSADTGTVRSLMGLLPTTDTAPLLVALTLRPEPSSLGWTIRQLVQSEYRHRTTVIDLGPLPDEVSEEMADALCPKGSLDTEARADIVARSQGNPLFVEELVRALSEGAGLERRRGWTLSVTAIGKQLPPALDSLLASRIQGLPEPGRRLAQAASILGRRFMVSTLEAIAGETEVRRELPGLLRREILREVRRLPRFECEFSHPLLQEATLGTLTASRMRHLYRLVGEALESGGGAEAPDAAETTAFYYYRSDVPERALPFLRSAAEKADQGGDRARARDLLVRARSIAVKIGDPDLEAELETRIAGLGG